MSNYTAYINLHKAQMKFLMDHISTEIRIRARKHDNSALGQLESQINSRHFDEYFSGKITTTDGIDDLCVASGSHYKENDHHPEHFSDLVSGMNLIQLMEYTCDLYSYAKLHDKNPYDVLLDAQGVYDIPLDIYELMKRTMKTLRLPEEMK